MSVYKYENSFLFLEEQENEVLKWKSFTITLSQQGYIGNLCSDISELL